LILCLYRVMVKKVVNEQHYHYCIKPSKGIKTLLLRCISGTRRRQYNERAYTLTFVRCDFGTGRTAINDDDWIHSLGWSLEGRRRIHSISSSAVRVIESFLILRFDASRKTKINSFRRYFHREAVSFMIYLDGELPVATWWWLDSQLPGAHHYGRICSNPFGSALVSWILGQIWDWRRWEGIALTVAGVLLVGLGREWVQLLKDNIFE
jgi:hypothetical protein